MRWFCSYPRVHQPEFCSGKCVFLCTGMTLVCLISCIGLLLLLLLVSSKVLRSRCFNRVGSMAPGS